ncbi:MAG: alpha/beta hydrolase [Candidatus Saccharibacteria bacterium]
MMLHSTQQGTGKPILFLHGMAASMNYWNPYLSLLSDNHKVIAVDLLGFGHSPQSKSGYSVQAHCQAIKDTLDSLNINEPITIVGHSMGALLALQYSINYPDSVSKLVLLSMPIYKNPAEAKLSITKSKKIITYAYYGPTSHIFCTTWCYLLRPLSKRLAHLYLPLLPRQVARDSVLHSWRSYSESLHNLIEIQSVESDLAKLKLPITIIYGDDEDKTVLRNMQPLKLLGKNVKIHVINGSHNVPLEQAEIISELISRKT